MSQVAKIGRPRGNAKAERRLKRELANKNLWGEIIGAARDIAVSFTDSAVSNPIVGVTTAIVTLDILYRVRVIGLAGYIAGLASIGLLETGALGQAVGQAAGSVVSGVGSIFPSIGSKTVNIASQENLIGTSPNNAISKNAGGGVGRTTVTASGITGQAVSQ